MYRHKHVGLQRLKVDVGAALLMCYVEVCGAATSKGVCSLGMPPSHGCAMLPYDSFAASLLPAALVSPAGVAGELQHT